MVLTGRGGYGNHRRGSSKQIQSSPAPIQTFTSPTQTFKTGRGGYGNTLPVSCMGTQSPADYMKEVSDAYNVEPARYSVGRGGAGNKIVNGQPQSPKEAGLARVVTTGQLVPSVSLRPSRSNEDSLWSRLKTSWSH